jgi:Ca2+-transporting ATPase
MQNKEKQKLWYQLSIREVFRRIGSRPGGLTSEEVGLNNDTENTNVLPDARQVSWLSMLFEQVKSPLVYVLIFAAIISFFVGELLDVIVILAAVVINTVVGFWQEYKADQTLQKLKSLVQQKVKVSRDGKEQLILAEELVVGDIMLLEAGDKVSADARIIEVNNAKVNEASLTGESVAVEKSVDIIEGKVSIGDRHNMVFLGTTVERGRIKAVVVAIGSQTQIGQIASLVESTVEEKTPLQLEMQKVSRMLTLIVLGTAFGIFVIGVLRGLEIEEVFITSAALAVSAIPEGLLIALTLVLVFGMKRILKKNALVRRIVAAETLGSVSIVCSDKTGTITEGKMQVDQMMIGGEMHDKEGHSTDKANEGDHVFAIKVGALCNNAYIQNPKDKLKESEIIGDATDAALLQAALQGGFTKEGLNKEYGRLDEIPFNEEYKFQATLHQNSEGAKVSFLKGSPERVLEMCSMIQMQGKVVNLTEELFSERQKEYDSMTNSGLRVLGLAYRKETKKITSFDELKVDKNKPALSEYIFIGWVGLKDPVRQEAPKAFQTMKKAKIRTVIITGDHKNTVKAIVKELGMDVLDNRIMQGIDLDKLSDEELQEQVHRIDIFARVEPKHKLRIIQALRARGEVVAMLGDGVNDAPALKASDIGVAVGDATDVAKETADMILLDGNFSVIESSIREGRVIFDNIRKIFIYLMADSFTGMMLITVALVLGYPIPLLVAQILFINIASDTFVNLALTVEPAENDVMSYPPRKTTQGLVNKEMMFLILGITAIAVTAVFGIFVWALNQGFSLDYARTLVFTTFAIDSAIYVFSIRSLRSPVWRVNPFKNKWLVISVVFVILMQLVVVYVPFFQNLFKTEAILLSHWWLILGVGVGEILVREVFKWFYWHKQDLALEQVVYE